MKKIALLVGIDVYPNAERLPSCANDVEGLSSILTMPEYGYTVRRLEETGATRDAVVEAIREIAIERPEVFLFFFSGHGSSDEFSGASLVLYDWSRNTPGLSIDEISRTLDRMAHDGSSVVAILDCCRAGALPVALKDLRRANLEVAVPSKPISRAVLAACKPDEGSYTGASHEKSIFTNSLCNALLGAAADESGDVNIGRVSEYISSDLEKIGIQSPVFKLDVEHRITLGRGLEPILRDETSQQVHFRLDREFGELLNRFAEIHAPSIMAVGQRGFAAACAALETIVSWSKKQITAYPFLSENHDFRSKLAVLNSNRARLASIQVGATIGIEATEAAVIERIGSGGFGVVYKIQMKNTLDSQLRALKVYHPNELDNLDKVSRFSRGYKAMKVLDWPTIVSVHDFTECPLGFTMSFIDGPNLKDFVPAHFNEPDYYIQALRLLASIAAAIQHAHSRDVRHRDIKPENIIVLSDLVGHKPYLTDFDLAWMSTASAVTRSAMGNAFYAPPEQFAYPDSYQSRMPTVDVYGFGQVCYFVLTKSDPMPIAFEANLHEFKKRIEKHVSGLARDRWIRLYEGCSQLRPGDRVQSFDEVLDALDELEGYHLTQSENRRITEKTFVGELVSRVTGHDRGGAPLDAQTFLSRTGRTSGRLALVELSDGFQLTADVQLQEKLRIAGTNFEGARTVNNQRIDQALLKISRNARRRNLAVGTYGARIEVGTLKLNHDNITECVKILRRVIEVLEQ